MMKRTLQQFLARQLGLWLLLLFAVVCPQRMWASLTGSGTAADPYKIHNEADLIAFRDIVNNASGGSTAVAMMAGGNIELSSTWTPIGINGHPFKGTFYGRNFSISGLSMNVTGWEQGLFGWIEGATIKDLTVSGTMTSTTTNGSCRESIGGVVGLARGVNTITNVHSNVNITMNHNNFKGVGGVVGKAEENYGISTITGCSYSGTLTLNSNIGYVGGVVGNVTQGATITNCSFTGAIKTCDGCDCIGGIIGLFHRGDTTVTIANCTNAGTMTLGNGSEIGGIMGHAGGNLKILNNTFASGATIQTLTSSTACGFVGGIAGKTDGTILIQQCTAAGSMNVASSYDCIAGIVGFCQYNSKLTIKTCLYSGSITSTSTNSDINRVAGIIAYATDNGNNFGGIKGCLCCGSFSTPSSNTIKPGAIASALYDNTLDRMTDNYYRNDMATAVVFHTSSGHNIASSNYSRTAAQISSGQVCYELYNGSIDGHTSWRQNIGTDNNPVLDQTHNMVYLLQDKYCDGTNYGSPYYSNNSTPVTDRHDFSSQTVSNTYLKTAATCRVGAVYYYKCSRCTASSKDNTDTYWTNTGSHTGHNYKDTWTWNGSTPTLKTVCQNTGCTAGSTTNLETTSQVVQAATCTAMGKTKYSAEALVGIGKGSTYQKFTSSTTLTDIAALGHTYGTGVWTWATNGKSATCTRTCTRTGCTSSQTGHTSSKTVNATATQKTAATCTVNGWNTYSVSATVEGTSYSDSKDVQDIPALGHAYTGSWNWTADGSNATLTLTCQNDASHKLTFDKSNGVSISSDETKATTCSYKGEHTYKATCTYSSTQYDAEDLVVADIAIDPDAHNYVDNECTLCHARTNVPYLAPVYNTPNDPTSGIASWTTDTAAFVKPLTDQTWRTTLNSGWYYVSGNIRMQRGAVCQGDVNLILTDGSSLVLLQSDNGTAGLNVTGTNSLTVYAQSEGSSMGKLSAGSGTNGAAIGGNSGQPGANITINGGDISATGATGAGIGGGTGQTASNIRINGGKVFAYCGLSGVIGLGGAEGSSGIYVNPALSFMAGNTSFDSDNTSIANDGSDLASTLASYRRVVIHKHIYGTPSWSWNSDGHYAKASVKCSAKGETLVYDTATTPKVVISSAVKTPAACTTNGITSYTATIILNGQPYTNTKDVQDIPATGHEWNEEGTWKWNQSYNSACYTRTCKHYAEHKDEHYTYQDGGSITSFEIPAGCETNGMKGKVATVTVDGKQISDTISLSSIPATGHSWGRTWLWADDGKSATLNLKCWNDASHTDSVSASVADGSITSSVTTPATCSQMGVTTYTASVVFDGYTYKDNKQVTDVPMDPDNHSFNNGTLASTPDSHGLYHLVCDGATCNHESEDQMVPGWPLYLNHNSSDPDGKYTLRYSYNVGLADNVNMEGLSDVTINTMEPNYYYRYMTNEWGTLVLPFQVQYDRSAQDSEGSYKLYTLQSVNAAQTELVFTECTEGTVYEAGTPLVVRATSALNDDNKYYIEITEYGDGDYNLMITTPSVVSGPLDMHGTYVSTTIGGNANTALNPYFIAQNQFWYAEAPVTIPAYRAWFEGSLASGAPLRFSIVEAEAGNGMVTELDEIGAAGNSDQAVKYIENDKLFIKKGGKVYNAAGQVVK